MTPGNVGITGLGTYVPEERLGNEELAPLVGVTPGWIESRTGIRSRSVLADEETLTSMAARAGASALADAGVDAAELGLITVASSTVTHLAPAVAASVQAALGAWNAVPVDLNAACSGFLYGLSLTHGQLASGLSRGPALVIGAERYSGIVDYGDRTTAPIFGDGAGAAVLGPVPEGYGLSDYVLGADGSKEAYVTGYVGPGAREPQVVRMHGRQVAEFFQEVFPQLIDDVLDSAGLKLADIDAVVTHQANVVLIRSVLDSLGVPSGKTWFTADTLGNTGAASIPITLRAGLEDGRLRDGATVLLAAVGAGMSWAGALLRWGPTGRAG